jgi:hypothetical protein
MTFTHVKTCLALGAGSWISVHAIKWAVPRCIPANPANGSLGYKIKRVYDYFLNSQIREIKVARIFLCNIYDFSSITLPLTYYFHFRNRLDKKDAIPFLKISIVYATIFKLFWIFLVYEPILYFSRNGSPSIAAIAKKIEPWAKPIAYREINNKR